MTTTLDLLSDRVVPHRTQGKTPGGERFLFDGTTGDGDLTLYRWKRPGKFDGPPVHVILTDRYGRNADGYEECDIVELDS